MRQMTGFLRRLSGTYFLSPKLQRRMIEEVLFKKIAREVTTRTKYLYFQRFEAEISANVASMQLYILIL